MSLDLIPTDELINEIFKRYDQAIICARKQTTDIKYSSIGRHKGDLHLVIGLGVDAILKTYTELVKMQTPISSDDI